MTIKPAVFTADYYNFEYKKGLKVCRLVFEVPYESAKLVREVLGDPPLPGEQVQVAIARLNAASVPVKPEVVSEPEPATADVVEPKRRSNLAAILVKENKDFRAWLVDMYWTGKEEVGDYDGLLKSVLKIASKKDLDTDGFAAARFDALRTDFELREMVR